MAKGVIGRMMDAITSYMPSLIRRSGERTLDMAVGMNDLVSKSDGNLPKIMNGYLDFFSTFTKMDTDGGLKSFLSSSIDSVTLMRVK